KNLTFENEKAAVDHALRNLRFFDEGGDAALGREQLPEGGARMHAGDGRHFPVAAMEGQQRPDIHIRHAVTVGEQEARPRDKGLDALDAATLQRIEPFITGSSFLLTY